jgi:hypothetical protein
MESWSNIQTQKKEATTKQKDNNKQWKDKAIAGNYPNPKRKTCRPKRSERKEIAMKNRL